MAQWIYAVIPYKHEGSFPEDDRIYAPQIPELEKVNSGLADRESLFLCRGFLEVNTCYKQNVFTEIDDGYSWLRAETCRIARLLNANEVWYVEELITDRMEAPDFSFDNWVNQMRTEKKNMVAELSVAFLKTNTCYYSYYHDDFSDIILDPPEGCQSPGPYWA